MSGVFHEDIAVVSAVALAAGSTGDKATFPCPFENCEVVRAWCEWEGTDNNATAAVVAFDKRITSGTDTGRVDGAFGIVKHAVSLNQQGKRTYTDRSVVTGFPTSHTIWQAGQQCVVEVTTAQGAALAFTAGLTVRRIPQRPADVPAMVATL